MYFRSVFVLLSFSRSFQGKSKIFDHTCSSSFCAQDVCEPLSVQEPLRRKEASSSQMTRAKWHLLELLDQCAHFTVGEPKARSSRELKNPSPQIFGVLLWAQPKVSFLPWP